MSSSANGEQSSPSQTGDRKAQHERSDSRPRGSQRAVGLTQAAVAAVEPWVTEAGPIQAVAAALVGTVTLLETMFAIETLGAAWRKAEPCECPPRHSPKPEETPGGPRHPGQEPGVAWAPGAWPEGSGSSSSLRIPAREGPSGWVRAPQGQGRHEMSPTDGADCPGWPVLPGLWPGQRPGWGAKHVAQHPSGVCTETSPRPSLSDSHLQRPDFCPSRVPSPTSGPQRGKDTRPQLARGQGEGGALAGSPSQNASPP